MICELRLVGMHLEMGNYNWQLAIGDRKWIFTDFGCRLNNNTCEISIGR